MLDKCRHGHFLRVQNSAGRGEGVYGEVKHLATADALGDVTKEHAIANDIVASIGDRQAGNIVAGHL